MNDPYLILTPILTILVVALTGFVGCEFVPGTYQSPPTDLVALAGDRRVDLRWTAPLGVLINQFVVWKGTASGDYSSSTVVPGTSTTWSDTDVMNGSVYYYAVSTNDETQKSNEVEARPAVPAIVSLVASQTLGTPRNDFGGYAGMGFTVGANDIAVKKLGRFVIAGNSGMHVLKIVDGATKADVQGASVTINLNGRPPGAFDYVALSGPVILKSNNDYYLVSSESNGGDHFHDSDTSLMTTAAASKHYAVNGDGAGNYTTSPVEGFAYGPVDLQY